MEHHSAQNRNWTYWESMCWIKDNGRVLARIKTKHKYLFMDATTCLRHEFYKSAPTNPTKHLGYFSTFVNGIAYFCLPCIEESSDSGPAHTCRNICVFALWLSVHAYIPFIYRNRHSRSILWCGTCERVRNAAVCLKNNFLHYGMARTNESATLKPPWEITSYNYPMG